MIILTVSKLRELTKKLGRWPIPACGNMEVVIIDDECPIAGTEFGAKDSPDVSWARGRNGWFTPKQAFVWKMTGGPIVLEVYSEKQGKQPPIIILALEKEEWIKILMMLLGKL